MGGRLERMRKNKMGGQPVALLAVEVGQECPAQSVKGERDDRTQKEEKSRSDSQEITKSTTTTMVAISQSWWAISTRAMKTTASATVDGEGRKVVATIR